MKPLTSSFDKRIAAASSDLAPSGALPAPPMRSATRESRVLAVLDGPDADVHEGVAYVQRLEDWLGREMRREEIDDLLLDLLWTKARTRDYYAMLVGRGVVVPLRWPSVDGGFTYGAETEYCALDEPNIENLRDLYEREQDEQRREVRPVRETSPLALDLQAIENLRPGETWTKMLVDASPYQEDGQHRLSLRALVERMPNGRFAVVFQVFADTTWCEAEEGEGLPEAIEIEDARELPHALACFRHIARHWERRLAQDAPIATDRSAEKEAA